MASNSVQVGDSFLHYVEAPGSGAPGSAVPVASGRAGGRAGGTVVFLHGNPTSSYLWRGVLGPVAAATGRRCVALDLIGMGGSGKPAIGYRLADHARYLDGFLDTLGDAPVTLVGHDWGGVLALDHARRRPDRVRGVAFLECHTRVPADVDDLFRDLRTDGVGERMVFEDNVFVEAVLQAGTVRRLTDEDLDAYRAPFTDPATRLPMLAFAREIPVAGEPADVAALVEANLEVVRDPGTPTLLLHATPGAVIDGAAVSRIGDGARSHASIDLGEGVHFLPEDRPAEIAAALTAWLPTV